MTTAVLPERIEIGPYPGFDESMAMLAELQATRAPAEVTLPVADMQAFPKEPPVPSLAPTIDPGVAESRRVQREFELGGDYGSDSSAAAYLGPVGVFATVIKAPGEAADYQRAFDEREISGSEFMAIMLRETAEAHMDSIKAAGAKMGDLFGRVHEAFASDERQARPVPESIVALAAGSAAIRRAVAI